MDKKEAITQLEIMATNATGRLGSAKSEEEKALLNKQIEALNMGIDTLTLSCRDCERFGDYHYCKDCYGYDLFKSED